MWCEPRSTCRQPFSRVARSTAIRQLTRSGERQPFIWTVDFGMLTLEDLLTERSLADEIAGWNLGLIDGISADGRYMIFYTFDGPVAPPPTETDEPPTAKRTDV